MEYQLRTERLEDYDGVAEVITAAFGRPNEARFVEAIRNARDFYPDLSIVARDGNRVVGHILFSEIVLRTPDKRPIPALCLAPVAVHPEYQRRGIGSALIREGLRVAARQGHRICVVVGHAEYYPRFGFEICAKHDIRTGFPCPEEAAMVMALVDGALDDAAGTIELPPEFEVAM
jgi:putative acetyltransferase